MQEISEICVVETLPVDDINKLVDKRNRTIGHFVKDGDENNFLLSKQWILQTLKENESLYDGFPLPFLSLLISDGDLESLYNLSLILPDQLLYLTKLLLLVHPKSQPIWHLRRQAIHKCTTWSLQKEEDLITICIERYRHNYYALSHWHWIRQTVSEDKYTVREATKFLSKLAIKCPNWFGPLHHLVQFGDRSEVKTLADRLHNCWPGKQF